MTLRKLYIISSTIFFLILYFVIPKGVDKIIMTLSLLNFYILFFFTLKNKTKFVFDTNFKTDTFFMIFYYLIFYLMYQGYLLGLNGLNSRWLSGFEEYANISLITSCIALNAFCYGITSKFKIHNQEKSNVILVPTSQFAYKTLAIVLALITMLLLFFYLKSGLSVLLVGRYTGSRTGDVATDGVFNLLTLFSMINLSLSLYFYYFFRKFKWYITFLLILIGIWIIILLIIGDRGHLLYFGLIFLAAYSSLFKKVTIKYLFIYMFIGLSFYKVIELSRKLDDRSFTNIVETTEEFFSSNNADGGFFSEDNSFFTTTVGFRGTFHLVPYHYDYTFGHYNMVGILGIVPFSRSLILNKNEFATTSDFLTTKLRGKYSVMGIGTNVVSDLYIEFGLIGVILFMYILGKYIYFVENEVRKRSHSVVWFVLYFVSLASISEIARYTYSSPIRTCVWAFVFIKVFTILFKKNINFKIKNI
jgi:oligosaccharide repeat unit polymerase